VTVDLGPHAAFILAAYGAAIGIVAALIIWVVLDRRHLNRMLHELESQGISRRSERAGEKKA
jgi:heme exporter protein D